MFQTSFTVTPTSGYVNATEFIFTNTTPITANIESIVWNFGDNTPLLYNVISPVHTYQYPGTYTITVTATDVFNNKDIFNQNITVDYLYRDYVLFTDIPENYAPPGKKTLTPFKVKVITSQIVDEISLELFAINSNSIPEQFVSPRWTFLNPTWKFTDINNNFIETLKITSIPIYYEDKVVAVSGEGEFFFIDDTSTGNPENNCPVLITCTLQTSGFVYPLDSGIYPYDSYANNYNVRCATVWHVFNYQPDILKITSNYIDQMSEDYWQDIKIPFIVSAHASRALKIPGSNPEISEIIFSYPKTNAQGSENSININLYNQTPYTILSTVDSINATISANFVQSLTTLSNYVPNSLTATEGDAITDTDTSTTETVIISFLLSSLSAFEIPLDKYSINEAPLYFQATDNNNINTGGYVFTTFTSKTTASSCFLNAEVTVTDVIEYNDFTFPDIHTLAPNSFIWVSNPERSTLNKITLVPYPSTCDYIEEYQNRKILIDGRVDQITTTVPFVCTDSTFNYTLTGFSGIYGMAIDPRNYELIAADAELDTIYKFSTTGKLISTLQFSDISPQVLRQTQILQENIGAELDILTTLLTAGNNIILKPVFNDALSLITLDTIDSENVYPLSSYEPIGFILPLSANYIVYDFIQLPQYEPVPTYTPGSISLDRDYNIWVSLFNDVSVLKFDKDFNLLFTASPSGVLSFYEQLTSVTLLDTTTFIIETVQLETSAVTSFIDDLSSVPLSPLPEEYELFTDPEDDEITYITYTTLSTTPNLIESFINNLSTISPSPTAYSILANNDGTYTITFTTFSAEFVGAEPILDPLTSVIVPQTEIFSFINNLSTLSPTPTEYTLIDNNNSTSTIEYTILTSTEINLSEQIFESDFLLKPPTVETDRYNNCWCTYAHPLCSMLVKYSSEGELLLQLPLPNYSVPVGLALDLNNNLWVSNTYNVLSGEGNITLYDSISGTVIESLTGIARPGYLAVDRNNHLWFTYSIRNIGCYDPYTKNLYKWKIDTREVREVFKLLSAPNLIEEDLLPSIIEPLTGISAEEIEPEDPNNIISSEYTKEYDEYTHDEELGGLAVDVYNRIWILDSYYNNAVVITNHELESININFRMFKIKPDSVIGYWPDPVTGDTITQNLTGVKSAQATGDWTGYKWYQKYITNFYYPSVKTITGQSQNFNINDFKNIHSFRQTNDSFNMSEYLQSLALPEIMQSYNVLWKQFMPGLVGDGAESNTEDIGRNIYERISNFVCNHRDVDTCNVSQLLSLAAETETPFLDYSTPLPAEIQKAIDLLSIPITKLFGVKNNYPNLIQSTGELLNIKTSILSAGQKIIVKSKYDNSLSTLVLPTLSGNTTLFPLSTFNFPGYAEPMTKNYFFYEYVPNYEDFYIDNIIDWQSPYTALSPNLSTLEDWYKDNGIIEKTFNYLLNKNLFYK
jgi:hypothetical protein